MKIDVQALKVVNNPAKRHFEVALDGKFGEIIYRKRGKVYLLIHTEVPEEFGGQGIAQHLVHEALEQIKTEQGMIVPLCPFIKSYLRRHPEYEALVVESPTD